MSLYSAIQVIGFDLDQTLYEKSPEVDAEIQKYIHEKIMEQRNCSFEEARTLFADLYKNGAGLSGSKTLEVLGVPNGKEIVQEALERANIARVLIPNQQTITLLKDLKKKYGNIDLLTGSDTRNARIKLDKLQIDTNFFNHFLTADITTKSDGAMYQLWLSKYDLPSEQFLYIGDRIWSDYEVPRELGIKSILVNISEKNSSVDCPQLPSLVNLRELLL